MRAIVLFILTISFAFGSLTDEAYKAYRAKNYKKAFMLYNKAYNQGSIKAAYNLAVFYQQGIGVKKDTKKAINYYKKVQTYIKSRVNSKNFCQDKMLKFHKKALKNLYTLSKNRASLKLLKNINKKCSINSDIKEFKYYKILAKRYPKTLKRVIYYKKLYTNEEVYSPKKAIYKKKLTKVAKPVMRFYLQKSITCVKRAKTYKDMQSCRFDRADMFDSIFGEDGAMSMMQGYADALHFFTPEDEKKEYYNNLKKKIPQKEKDMVIKEIKNLIKNCNFRCVDFVYQM